MPRKRRMSVLKSILQWNKKNWRNRKNSFRKTEKNLKSLWMILTNKPRTLMLRLKGKRKKTDSPKCAKREPTSDKNPPTFGSRTPRRRDSGGGFTSLPWGCTPTGHKTLAGDRLKGTNPSEGGAQRKK